MQVMFQWRASEHFDFHDVYVGVNEASREDPWDFFHINMVEKDSDGNYLVSTRYAAPIGRIIPLSERYADPPGLRSRYGHCGLYISGKTGETLWQLGGKKNDFTDLSNGEATTYLGQHDIHWVEKHKTITMFDNRADWGSRTGDSRGIRVSIDLDRMTAKLMHSYTHPDHIVSVSQGSYQTLPNGNVLLGFGYNGALTEYAAKGEVLCDAYMQPSSTWDTGNVQSYRNLKFEWTGIPLTSPDIAFDSEKSMLFISWLGTTKTRKWMLQDCDSADGLFTKVRTMPNVGFETELILANGKRMRRYVQAVAVDEDGTYSAVSAPVDLVEPSAIWPGVDEGEGAKEDVEGVPILYVLGILVAISAALLWMSFCTRCIPSGILDLRDKSRFQIQRAWAPARSRRESRKSWRDSLASMELLGNDRDSLLEGDEATPSSSLVGQIDSANHN